MNTQIVKTGAIVCRTENKGFSRNLDGTVIENDGAYIPDADQFLINTGTSIDFPYITFGALTGRTRRMWGMDMPTIERYEVLTVVRDIEMPDGTVRPSIMGVPGDRITGTFVTRPENVVDAS